MRCDELSRKPSFRPGRGSSGQTAPLRALSILCAALLALIPRTGLSADLTNGATGITAAPLVEVDPGHTPKRYGAVGAWGDREVELNDALARDLCSEIRSRGAALRPDEAAMGGDLPYRKDAEGKERRCIALHLSAP